MVAPLRLAYVGPAVDPVGVLPIIPPALQGLAGESRAKILCSLEPRDARGASGCRRRRGLMWSKLYDISVLLVVFPCCELFFLLREIPAASGDDWSASLVFQPANF